jgi:hypothetical protein
MPGWESLRTYRFTVQGRSFADVKKTMEAALQHHIETVLRQNAKTKYAAGRVSYSGTGSLITFVDLAGFAR